jgi:hypothetical protein
MRAAAVAFTVVLTIICLWWILGYVARRTRGGR